MMDSISLEVIGVVVAAVWSTTIAGIAIMTATPTVGTMTGTTIMGGTAIAIRIGSSGAGTRNF